VARFLEAVDCITTVYGNVDQAMLLYGDSLVAPMIAGVVTFVSGSFFRYFEQRGHLDSARYTKGGEDDHVAETLRERGAPEKYVFAEWNAGISKAVWYTTFYWYFGKIRNKRADQEYTRLIGCAIFVALDFLEEILPGWDPLRVLDQTIASAVRWSNTALRLGPPCTATNRLLR
jgi:hypothetical protein